MTETVTGTGPAGATPVLSVLPRFRGPPDSANGGYFAGLVAALAPTIVRVRLRRPPPLAKPLQVQVRTGSENQPGDDPSYVVLDGELEIAEARAANLPPLSEVPPGVPYMAALVASRRFAGFARHIFPGCFVCGTERARGDGLRLFPGPVVLRSDATQIVAAPWMPDASLGLADGKVAPEFIHAALDCPGGFAVQQQRSERMLLGEFTAHVDRRVRIDEPCVVIGWAIRSEGRRHEAGTALFDEDGELCARAHALWIEPRDPATAAASPGVAGRS